MTSRRWALVATAMVAAGVAFITPAAARLKSLPAAKRAKAHDANAERIAKLLGRYRFAGDKREVEALEAAIDDAVSDMNIFVREVARRKLRKITEIPKSLSLAVDDEVLTVEVASIDYSAPLDGSAVRVKGPTGDDLTLRHHVVKEARLLQSFENEDGSRINTCELDAKERLRVHVRIHSDKLENDLTYSLTFVKKS